MFRRKLKRAKSVYSEPQIFLPPRLNSFVSANDAEAEELHYIESNLSIQIHRI